MIKSTLNSPEVVAQVAGGAAFDQSIPKWLLNTIEAVLRHHAPLYGKRHWTGVDVVTVSFEEGEDAEFQVLPGMDRRPLILLDLTQDSFWIRPSKDRKDARRQMEGFLGAAYAEAYIARLGIEYGALDAGEVIEEFAQRVEEDGPDSALVYLEREGRVLQDEFGGPKEWNPGGTE